MDIQSLLKNRGSPETLVAHRNTVIIQRNIRMDLK